MASARAGAFLELTKPRITQLVVLTAAAGFYLASREGVDLALLAHTLLGVALTAAGTNAMNQVRERDADALMHRTRGRPLPAGRLGTREAWMFASLVSVAGIAYLAVAVNLITAGLAALTLASYVGLYTPLKKRTSLNTLVGAVPGALPVVGGWTAAGGRLDVAAAALFGILFLWQLPHFLALAWIYRADYAQAGFRMLSVGDPDGRATGRQAALAALALVPASLVPALLGLSGRLYFVGALALGGLLVGASVGLALQPSGGRARRLFVASVLYLPVLLTVMAVDKAIGL